MLDLTTVFMGPSATQYLADLGADVIKIESPQGDSTRKIGPCGEDGLGPLFLGLNRSKRSVVLDLKTPDAVRALLRLAQDADVLATNVRPAAMRRLGLAPEQVLDTHPQLIYASMVGFSQRGPYGPKAAFDDMIQAASGLASVAGQASDGSPGYVPLTIADRSVGLYAFGVISAALYARERTGRGQHVEVPMFETMVPYVLGDHLYGRTFVPGKGDFGYPRLLSKHRRPYRTKDGHVCCLIYTDRQWALFLNAVGKGDWMDSDPRLQNIRTRTQAIEKLPFDIDRDLRMIGLISRTSMLLAGKANGPHTLQALIAHARANPGQVTYGSAGVGSISHIVGAAFERAAGIELTHVPYKGNGPAMTDLTGGHVDLVFDGLTSSGSLAEQGRIRLLAISGEGRNASAPDLPTFGEQGLPDYDAYSWNCLFAPSGTPADRIARLNGALNQALEQPSIQERFVRFASSKLGPTTPDMAEAYGRKERERWVPFVRSLQIQMG